MSHAEQQEFCKRVRGGYPQFFQNARVLDVGSRDFNGSNAFLFDHCEYIGCDLTPGPNVTLVGRCHELLIPSESLDMIVSTEMLEHDPFRPLSLAKMVDMLKPGGHLLITCAAPGRPRHNCDPHAAKNDDYYDNVDSAVLLSELGPRMSIMHVEVRSQPSLDLYYFGKKL